MEDQPRRIWRYRYGDWTPSWFRYLLPDRGGDEWHRTTIVVHVPLVGFVVIALGKPKTERECKSCASLLADGILP
jgi:hypothetical protein